ncbi:MAG: DNA repair protein RecO [Candidatus Levybacteria bacterium RIFCSPHIGHO2_02_FULL_42_12]|nr:MAG: DNA repair protein RecO [Candidatus Levybacteria bacterium RIFCSPHIGHO2_01_FULL_42_15]OGH33946.1 MAG: DNA repair protein RecO [Candidatus Levybacteria bacterium RIFCSPHIGHO2_02_FULL_42_12]OGH42881.1 MAG: DNA repair protein RecO [Candidatus Levybacteria bacterium RIFCSPLOWO2_01_FULL_42_15]
MRSYTAEGIIIRRRNIGEGDRILTVLTKKNGKIHIKAVGVRKITSRRSPHIEPLNHGIFTLYKPPRGYAILTEANTVNTFSLIKSDLKRIGYAYHLCELIDSLCAENFEQANVFLLFKNALTQLSTATDLSFISVFERELLVQLGFYPRESPFADTQSFIESILERRLKTKRFLHRFA